MRSRFRSLQEQFNDAMDRAPAPLDRISSQINDYLLDIAKAIPAVLEKAIDDAMAGKKVDPAKDDSFIFWYRTKGLYPHSDVEIGDPVPVIKSLWGLTKLLETASSPQVDVEVTIHISQRYHDSSALWVTLRPDKPFKGSVLVADMAKEDYKLDLSAPDYPRMEKDKNKPLKRYPTSMI